MFNGIDSYLNYSKFNKYSSFIWNYSKDYHSLLSELNSFIKLSDIPSENPEIYSKSIDEYKVKHLRKWFTDQNEKRIIVIPPVYCHVKNVNMNLNGLSSTEMNYLDIYCIKKPLLISELKSIVNDNLSISPVQSSNKYENSIWNDEVIKKMVQNREIDIVINLNSFVKLILASLKEIKERCHLPFLKIRVETTKRHCLIFDKIMYEKINIDKEIRNNLKRSFSKKYSQIVLKKNNFQTRITKNPMGITDFDVHSCLEDFAKGSLREDLSEIGEDISILNVKEIKREENISIASGQLIIDDEPNADVISLTHDSDTDITKLYSYGIWKIKNRNVLFRYSSPVLMPNSYSSSEQTKAVTCRVLLKKNNSGENLQLEELWKILIAGKVRLQADLLQIIIDEEKETIEKVTLESYEDFVVNHQDMVEKLSIVLSSMDDLFDDLQNNNCHKPDFYNLLLTETDVQLLRSTNDMNECHLDLRKFCVD